MDYYLYINEHSEIYVPDLEELPNHLDYYKKLIRLSEDFYKNISHIQFFTIDPRREDVAKHIDNCSSYFKCVVTFDIGISENLKGLNILSCSLVEELDFDDHDGCYLDNDDPF